LGSQNPPNEVPTLPWARVLAVAVAGFLAAITGLEASWRIFSFRPNVEDSTDLWAYHRSRVVGGDPKIVVAIGTSRIRADLSLGALAEYAPGYRFAQLGVNGPTSAIGLLCEISTIPRFCGVVLCDVPAPLLDRNRWDDQASYYALTNSTQAALDAYLHCLLCDRLLVLNSSFSLRSCLGTTRSPNRFFRVHADRSLEFDEVANREEHRANWEKHRERFVARLQRARKYKNIEEFRENIAPLEAVVTRIVRNGGRVVFVRLPATGERLLIEESAFPAPLYFNALSKVMSADWIDFRDLVDQELFDCPDGSHLSPRGARSFSRSLCSELMHRGIIRR
jgi:hypothetical protein